MKLQDRVAKLETAFEPEIPAVIVMSALEGEPYETTLARHEATHGLINDPHDKAIKVLILELAGG